VANSAALKLSGIDKNTASPFGGEILKDKQSGEPTGMLIDAAQGLLRSQVPSTTAATQSAPSFWASNEISNWAG